MIVVGLTGVGKSTVLENLRHHLDFTLLPNRREVTDAIIIAAEQTAADEPQLPVTDRLKRFEYTARYRARNPGGMGHALSRLVVKTDRPETHLVFDGLRGLNEVQSAAAHFSQARFVVLDAPDMVRLTRLLDRGDAFDQAAVHTAQSSQNTVAALMGIKDIEAVFNKEECRQIARVARSSGWASDDVVKKTSIIIKERRNYNPDAARVHLQHTVPPARLLTVDTDQHSAAAVTDLVNSWLTTHSGQQVD